MANDTFEYVTGFTVPAFRLPNGTALPGHYAPNGSVIPADFYANGTMISDDDCNLYICNQLTRAFVMYAPDQVANGAFLLVFALCFVAQIPLGIYWKTWGYLIGMSAGLIMEAVGQVGRLMLHHNQFKQDGFMIYIVCLTIGPAFLSAAIYLCLARIISVYGKDFARFRPFVYTVVFMFSDFVSLCLQGAGGGLASQTDPDTIDMGKKVMIAGLAFQVVSLTIYIALASDYAFLCFKKRDQFNPHFRELRQTFGWKLFLLSLTASTILIFIRSVYRVAELSAGFKSKFANEENTYIALESVMVSCACILLTVFHPGLIFRRNWSEANYRLNEKKGDSDQLEAKEIRDSSSSSLDSGYNQYYHPPAAVAQQYPELNGRQQQSGYHQAGGRRISPPAPSLGHPGARNPRKLSRQPTGNPVMISSAIPNPAVDSYYPHESVLPSSAYGSQSSDPSTALGTSYSSRGGARGPSMSSSAASSRSPPRRKVTTPIYDSQRQTPDASPERIARSKRSRDESTGRAL